MKHTASIMHSLKTFSRLFNSIAIPKSPCDWKQQFCHGSVVAALNLVITTVRAGRADARTRLGCSVSAQTAEEAVCPGSGVSHGQHAKVRGEKTKEKNDFITMTLVARTKESKQ